MQVKPRSRSDQKFRRKRRTTGTQVGNQPIRGDPLPATALHENLAEQLRIFERVPRGVLLEDVRAEDETVSCIADALLLRGLQLARPELVKGIQNTTVGLGTFWSHPVSSYTRRTVVVIFSTPPRIGFSHLDRVHGLSLYSKRSWPSPQTFACVGEV
jgi:hypothetical protein